jgi:hypothetical protein
MANITACFTYKTYRRQSGFCELEQASGPEEKTNGGDVIVRYEYDDIIRTRRRMPSKLGGRHILLGIKRTYTARTRQHASIQSVLLPYERIDYFGRWTYVSCMCMGMGASHTCGATDPSSL